ncbi:hypothetical protein FH972_026501 [Carpinus fangiana]|uniref:Uncharacterized protein n=1 Tax=Carpinus fangiana TaxID=176857 RepID=A0A5N6L4I8_9ROSI|nr:hypothetical protein FH972_026501 [Carpinus fangiana]
MPRPKYRAPVEKKHKELLESFDFISSWRNPLSRRGSHDWSLYSPGGSRLPSRNNSFSGARPKFQRGKSSVGHQVVENVDEIEDLTNIGMSRGASRRPSKEIPRPQITTHDSTNPKNPHNKPLASHSKHASGNALHHVGALPSRSQAAPPVQPAEGAEVVPGGGDGAVVTGRKHAGSTAHDHTPFSQEELEQALRKVPTFAEEDEDDFTGVKPTTL